MDKGVVVRRRLRGLGLRGPEVADPGAVVSRLGAIQGQEFAYALWSIGQRTKGVDEARVRELLDVGAILRTHLLRPTWHLVTPRDIRWILTATAPRIHQKSARRYEELGLGSKDFITCHRVLTRELAGGNHLTRKEAGAVLEGAGIDTTGQRLPYLLSHAELEAVICSGAMKGKQQTYALLEERAPDALDLDPDAALEELTRLYFTTRGPATLKDFSWWASLTMGGCREGLEMVGDEVVEEVVDGRRYWHAPSRAPRAATSQRADLIQVYDEYVMSYTESRDVIGAPLPSFESPRMHGVLMDGKVVGYWKRTSSDSDVAIEIELIRRLGKAESQALDHEVTRFGRFVGKPVTVGALLVAE